MAKKKKKTKQLTQAEIWDDSALLKSWDEALEEYHLYHSIHARGERVEDVLKTAEMAEAGSDETGPSSSAAMAQINGANAEDLEDGELEDEAAEHAADVEIGMDQSAKRTEEPASSQHPSLNHSLGHNAGTASMPLPAFAGGESVNYRTEAHITNGVAVKDEALKNLMMSWYYAGYYTGFYEGQRKAVHNSAPNNTS